MPVELTRDRLERAFATVWADALLLREETEGLRVDTPYVLQDGHLLQVTIRPEGDALVVSDQGFAASQLETVAPSAAALKERYGQLARIARELGLEWDTDFRYSAPDAETAARRLGVMARAVDRALTLAEQRPKRVAPELRARLGQELRERGLKVRAHFRIPVLIRDAKPSEERQSITVDYHLQKNGAQAAVEVIAGRTRAGTAISLDRAVTNFHVLAHAQFEGELVAVYDEASPAARSEFLTRFESARPPRCILVPGKDAAQELYKLLSH